MVAKIGLMLDEWHSEGKCPTQYENMKFISNSIIKFCDTKINDKFYFFVFNFTMILI